MSTKPLAAESTEAPWHAGLRSARATIGPAAVILIAAAAVVTTYYQTAPTREWLERLVRFRGQHDLAFAPVVTMVFSGLVPLVYLRLNPRTARAHPWSHLPFFALFWAYKGVETNFFYRLLVRIFGSGHDWLTITQKALFENFVWNLAFTIPGGVMLYAWKDAGFNVRAVLADLRAGRWYYRRVLPVLLSCWVVWLPAGGCIYALPFALQIMLFNLLNCFWVIFLAHVIAQTSQPPPAEGIRS